MMKPVFKIFVSVWIALLAAGVSWSRVPTSLTADQARPALLQYVAQPKPSVTPQPTAPPAEAEISPQPGLKEPKILGPWRPTPTPSGLQRADSQGAVNVVVTPLNLDNPGNTLDFEVSLDSATVDLKLNLAKLASLTTDNRLEVSASAWQPEGAGQHVTGRLTFPSLYNGSPLLGFARVLTLSLRHVNVPLRTFTWELKRS